MVLEGDVTITQQWLEKNIMCSCTRHKVFVYYKWTECTAEIETATASLLKLHHVVNLLPLLSPEVT